MNELEGVPTTNEKKSFEGKEQKGDRVFWKWLVFWRTEKERTKECSVLLQYPCVSIVGEKANNERMKRLPCAEQNQKKECPQLQTVFLYQETYLCLWWIGSVNKMHGTKWIGHHLQGSVGSAATKTHQGTKLQHLQRIIKKLITLIPPLNILSIREITKRFKSKYSLTTANKLWFCYCSHDFFQYQQV